MGKKVYKDRRDMVLICTACRCRWKNCTCLNINKSTFIFVTEEELLRYEQTGLVPNFKEEIMSFVHIVVVLLQLRR